MTSVQLKKFTFALPMAVSTDNENAGNYVSSTEFPHEFFGLEAILQVSVINSVMNALIKISKNLEVNNHLFYEGTASFPINIGISVTVIRKPKLFAKTVFSYPDNWDLFETSMKVKIIESICYLLQTSAVTIVKREEHLLEGQHE